QPALAGAPGPDDAQRRSARVGRLVEPRRPDLGAGTVVQGHDRADRGAVHLVAGPAVADLRRVDRQWTEPPAQEHDRNRLLVRVALVTAGQAAGGLGLREAFRVDLLFVSRPALEVQGDIVQPRRSGLEVGVVAPAVAPQSVDEPRGQHEEKPRYDWPDVPNPPKQARESPLHVV